MGAAHWLVFQCSALAVIAVGPATSDPVLAGPRHRVGAQLVHISVVLAGPLSYFDVSLTMVSAHWFVALVPTGTAIHVAAKADVTTVATAAACTVFPSVGSARLWLNGMSSRYRNGNGHPNDAKSIER